MKRFFRTDNLSSRNSKAVAFARQQRAEANEFSEKVEKVSGFFFKYVRLLEKQLRTLQNEDTHGNRRLFLDDVFVAYLLAFFNPTICSLRTIEDLSQTQQAQKL